MAVGSIMAAAITGTNTWSGVPIAVGALGTALASWPLARLMERSGRRLRPAAGRDGALRSPSRGRRDSVMEPESITIARGRILPYHGCAGVFARRSPRNLRGG